VQATGSVFDNERKSVHVVSGIAVVGVALPAIARNACVVRARPSGVAVRRGVCIRRRVVGIHIGAGVGIVGTVGRRAVAGVVVADSTTAASAAETAGDHQRNREDVEERGERNAQPVENTVEIVVFLVHVFPRLAVLVVEPELEGQVDSVADVDSEHCDSLCGNG